MVSINPLNNDSNSQRKEQLHQSSEEKSSSPSVWAGLCDDNGIVDMTDVRYSQEGARSKEIATLLKIFNGEKWTDSLKAKVGQLIVKFNLQQKYCQDASLEKHDSGLQADFNKFVGQLTQEFQDFAESSYADFNAMKQLTGLGVEG